MGRLAIVENGVVVNVIVSETPFGEGVACSDEVGIGWSFNGSSFAAPRNDDPPLSDLVDAFRVAIQGHVDETARSRAYNDGTALASYAGSTVAQWAAEAAVFIAWRDAVWAYAYAEMDKVETGERAVPTVEGFIDEMPLIEWPLLAA